MPTVVSIKDLRDAARFSELVEERSKAKLMARIAVSERERAEHAGRDAFEHVSELRAHYGA